MRAKSKAKLRRRVPKRVAKVRQSQPQVEKQPSPPLLKCKFCGQDFKNLAGVNGHMAVKHGEKRPPKVKMRDKFAIIETRLTTLEGRSRALEMARMQQPLGAGSPAVEELAESLARWSTGTCGPSQRAFRQVMRGFLGLE